MFENTTTHCTLQLMRDDPVFLIDMTVMFPYAGSSIQNASEQFVSCIHLPSVNWTFMQPHNKNLTELRLVIQTALSW